MQTLKLEKAVQVLISGPRHVTLRQRARDVSPRVHSVKNGGKAYDVRIGLLIGFAGRRCGGPEVYEREIVRALCETETDHEYHLYCLDRRAQGVIGVPPGQVVYHQLEPSVRIVSMAASLPRVISRTRPDIFHATVMPPPFCPSGTIMQMPCSSLMLHPEFYPPFIRLRLRFLFHRAVKKSAKVICVSEHVRQVTQERFRLPSDRLTVIHPGVSSSFRVISREVKRSHMERHGIRNPFFLISGRWEKRKNLERTLEAFALFKRAYRTDHKLAISGGHSWHSKHARAVIHRLQLEDEIVDLGRTHLDELPHIYGSADAVVYASLWEGFGMPIVEAMACGTPVITSNVAAMPETAGGHALLVNPRSTEEIAAAMHRISTDSALRVRLQAGGLKHAQNFTWSKAAKQILQLYEAREQAA